MFGYWLVAERACRADKANMHPFFNFLKWLNLMPDIPFCYVSLASIALKRIPYDDRSFNY